MSEALSSTEIEDVLSSIRRLVSDDLRPASRTVVPGKPVATGEKLILTPALRVVADGPELLAAPVFVPHPRPVVSPAGSGIEQVVASLGAAVGPASAEWEAETGDFSPDFAQSHGADDDWTLPQASDDLILASEDPSPVADVTDPDFARADHARADFANADFADTDLTDAFFTDADLIDSLEPAQNFVFASARMAPAAMPALGDPAPANLHPDLQDEILTAPPASDVTPGWAQDDGHSQPDDEPEADPMPPASHGTLEPDAAWADAAEASVIAALSSDEYGAAEDDADAADLLPEDDSLLFNEEVLRELVRDILREELAGRMGERITRNIRKLVRAEIARSFAAQEFD